VAGIERVKLGKRLGALSRRGGDGGKGEIFNRAAVIDAPLVKETAVAEGDVAGGIDAETGGRAVNPIGRAFELGVVADGRFIDDAVPLAVGPLGAPFFIVESGDEAEGEKKLGERTALSDRGFSFDAMLVTIGIWITRARGCGAGKSLVSESPMTRVTANAKDFGAGAHLAIRRVVKSVAFEAARSFEAKAGGFEPLGEGGEIGNAEFDLGFDGHGSRRV